MSSDSCSRFTCLVHNNCNSLVFIVVVNENYLYTLYDMYEILLENVALDKYEPLRTTIQQ